MEQQNKVKILVAIHKPDKVYGDKVYMPIQVGKSLSEFNLGFQGDNTGDNISEMNSMFCELTAHYWAWKNLQCEYIGVVHYRRYFDYCFSEENVDKIFNNYDIILTTPIVRSLPLSYKLNGILAEYVIIFLKVLERMYPEYKSTALNYIYNGNKDICYNMFLTRKDLFDKYAEWEFSILQECRKYIKLTGYKNADRLYGCFGEYLLPIYAIYNQLRIKYLNVTSFPINGHCLNRQSWPERLFNNFRYKMNHIHTIKEFPFPKAALLGMKSMPELEALFDDKD